VQNGQRQEGMTVKSLREGCKQQSARRRVLTRIATAQ
jgi:hypothetical protein